MSANRVTAVVSTLWLKSQLATAPRSVRVLDASWAPLKAAFQDYKSKHIPGASFFDMNRCVQPLPTLARNLPDPACFAPYVRSLGVSDSSHVVVYSNKNLVSSARAWWLFRLYGHQNVSVLDGGLDQWEADGFGLQDGEGASSEDGNFTVNIDSSLMRDFDSVVDVIESGSSQIIDCRKPAHYNGLEEEPSKYTVASLQGMGQPLPTNMKRGHMRGAVNVVDDLIANDNSTTIMTPDEIRKVLRDAGIDLEKPVTTLCYNGHAACLMALATAVCGKHDTVVYYGSWTEFGQRADDSLLVSPTDSKPSSGG